MPCFINLQPFGIIIKKMKAASRILRIPGGIKSNQNSAVSDDISCSYKMYSFFMEAITRQRIDKWLTPAYDQATRDKIQELQKEHPEELEDAFYKNLEFGTGGLRGVMGVGTNRINKYTIGMATQGYANYLKKCFTEIKVAIAHDSRNNSREFAEITAAVFDANGIKVFLFESLRPTPELSFA